MKINYFLIIFLALFGATGSYASGGFSLGIGEDKDSINIYRFGVRKQFDSKWADSKTGYFTGYHEVSLGYWKYGSESISVVSYSPVFTYEFYRSNNIFPYLEAGIGASYLSKKVIRGRDLSSNYQFEDRIGIGVKFGKQKSHDLNLRYMHYSNAGIKQPNDGIDIFIFSYSYIY